MKTKLLLIGLLLAVGVLAGAALPQRIRWTWNDGRRVQWQGTSGSIVNFGLRDDGVVVWREITTTTNQVVTTTNSPAEREEAAIQGTFTNTIYGGGITFTNGQWMWEYKGTTNNILPLRFD